MPQCDQEDAQDGSGGKDSCDRLLCRTETGGSEPDRRSVPCLRCEGQIPGGRKDDGHAPRGGDGLGGQFQAAEHGCRVQGNLQGDSVCFLDRRKDPLVPQGSGRLQQLLRLLYGALRQRRFQEYSDSRGRLPGRADRCGRSPRDCPHGSEHRGFRAHDRRKVPRPAEKAQRRRRHRKIQDFIDRAESDHLGDNRLDRLRDKVPASFPHSSADRFGHASEKGGEEIQHGFLRGKD